MLKTYLVILVFGRLVGVAGPATDEECRLGLIQGDQNITIAFNNGSAPTTMFGRTLTRRDMVLGCITSLSRPVIEGEVMAMGAP